ncbi:hypothetical protein Golomagni_06602, partial [Golovinomyces magnicellulatus]
MAFLEDPRLRQRWNQITHEAENVTENAAAGIWSLKEFYINPCFGYMTDSIEQCTAMCLGDPEERLRRRRERERAQAENSFDFYDDWNDDEQDGSGSFFGSWGGDDWDRLLAGTGNQRKQRSGTETTEQPRRKRGMSYGTNYGTRGSRRKTDENDPTIIPSTQPIGFLAKLPWKMGGTLRYKPSAADLQDHPGKADNPETEPLLVSDDESDYGQVLRQPRKRAGTTGSGDTSDSYRSRGDLFPSDGEGEEDAVPLDDEVTYDMVRKGSRSRTRTQSSKGKRPVDKFAASRTVSRTTLNSTSSHESLGLRRISSTSLAITPTVERVPSLQDLQVEERRLEEEEEEERSRQQRAAEQLATQRGLRRELSTAVAGDVDPSSEAKPIVENDE